jgi:hypothetical protein
LASVAQHLIIMSGLRGMVKDGWHPKGKQGGKESWRGDFKGIGQVVSIYVAAVSFIFSPFLMDSLFCIGRLDGKGQRFKRRRPGRACFATAHISQGSIVVWPAT